MHRLAKILCLATLCLIFAGGLVKSTETGLSDKTWPQFNGGYEPMLHGETLFEHAHRLIAGAVATAMVALAVASFWLERRRWVRGLAVAGAVAVVCQAVLGGLTVLFKLDSLAVSIAHAGLAQAFFQITVALAVVTSPSWREAHEGELTGGSDRALRRLAHFTAVAVYAQILLGAWVRYTPGAAYAIPDFPLSYGRLVPRFDGFPIVVQFVHRCGALVVTLLAAATIARVASRHRSEPRLARPAIALGAALATQILLGGATIWTVKAVVPTTLHVATAAVLLACAHALVLYARVVGEERRERDNGDDATTRQTTPREMSRLRAVGRLVAFSSFLSDLSVLTKFRIAILVLIATAAGFYLAWPSSEPFAWVKFCAAIVGTGVLAGGSAALNQVLERDADALMRRTADRPLPAGRLSPRAAVAIGLGCAAVGVAVLALGCNVLAAALGAATLASYVCIYTPLKRVTWVSTIVGAVPGALPPVMGWAAARGSLSYEAWALFAIVFFWQLPHFFAIAWLNREDYARGGFPMLPVIDGDGMATANQILFSSLALVPVSLVPAVHGVAGPSYFVGALVLSLGFLGLGAATAFARTEPNARRLFLGSLAYLPLLFALMTLDKV